MNFICLCLIVLTQVDPNIISHSCVCEMYLKKFSFNNQTEKKKFLQGFFFGIKRCVPNEAPCSITDDLLLPLALSCEGR